MSIKPEKKEDSFPLHATDLNEKIALVPLERKILFPDKPGLRLNP